MCIDSNPDACRDAEERGFQVLQANALEERTLELADVDTRAGVIGVTPVEEVNLLFCQKAREQSRSIALHVALETTYEGVTPDMVHGAGASVMFADAYNVDAWSRRMEDGGAAVERWRCVDAVAANRPPDSGELAHGQRELALPLGVEHAGRVRPVHDETEFHDGDVLTVALDTSQRQEAEQHLIVRGWRRIEDAPARRDSAA